MISIPAAPLRISVANRKSLVQPQESLRHYNWKRAAFLRLLAPPKHTSV